MNLGFTQNDGKNEPSNGELISDEFTFRQDVTIDSGSVSDNNIRIVGGDLIVHGIINGKISLFGGDVFLKNGSVLNGEIITIGGNIYIHPSSTVNGKIIENNFSKGLIYRETDKEDTVHGTTEFDVEKGLQQSHVSWIHPKRPTFKYNRNEGLVFMPFNERWDRRSLSNFRLNWSVGVRWRKGFTPDYIGRATFEKSFFETQDVSLFASLFKEARTDDAYRLPQEENGLANFLARQDFYDRWDESGWETGFGFNIFQNIRIKTRFVSAEQDSIPLWQMSSVFESDRTLRPNLKLDPKTFNYTEISLMVRTNNYSTLSNGAALYIQSEFIQSDSDSSTVYTMDYGNAIRRTLALFVCNWEFSEGLVFRSRFMAGSGGESMPSHRLFNVGGLGSVEAQPYKAQQGNQMALLNLALYLTPEFTDGNWLISFFTNGGRAWNNTSWGTSWISDDPKTAISSAGIGIGYGDWHEFDWMINIAKSLDHDALFQTTIRLNHTF